MELTSQIRAVIFDMDGVLTDSEPLINEAAVRMFREHGLQVQPVDFVPFVGTGEDRYIGGVAEKYGFSIDLVAAKKRTYEIYLELVPERLAAFPGATRLVQACRHAGLKIALASSADRVKIEANLRKIGLPPEHWDAIVCAEDVTRKKPAPDIFLAAARKLGLAPHECVVIEDAVNGVQAAKAAGMLCVAVAQTFAPENLRMADLIKPGIVDLFVEDLLANSQSGMNAALCGSSSDGRNPSVTGHHVSPHPGPLPQGEGAVQSAHRPAQLFQPAEARESVPPLPTGEGRGEGVGSAVYPATSSTIPAQPRSPLPACLETQGEVLIETAPRPWGFWATIGLSLAIGVADGIAQVMVGVVWVFATGSAQRTGEIGEWASSGLFLAIATCTGTPVIVGLAWLFASFRPMPTVREYLALRPVAGRTVFRWCLGLSVLMITSDSLTSILGRPIVPEFMTQAYRTAGFVPLLWLAVIVAAPLGEEILFRGFLFQGLAHSRLGGWGAIIVGSGVWAAVHLQYDFYGMATIFVGGLVLGYARLKTGSIYPPIVMHAVMNLIATIQVAVQEQFHRV